jgi:hypothetical protein
MSARSTRRAAGPPRYVAGFASLVIAIGLLAGCTTARSNLGTSDSSCYSALPAATKAVHSHGHLFGLHRLTLSGLRRQAPHLVHDLATKEPGAQSICVVAFQGHFTAGSVSDPRGQASGRLAVVVSTAPGNRLLGTVIFTRAPLHFGHFH